MCCCRGGQRLTKDLKDVSSSTGADLQSARTEVSRLTGRVTSLEKELSAAKDDCEQSNRLVEALKKQVEELRKEIKDVMREAAAKLEVMVSALLENSYEMLGVDLRWSRISLRAAGVVAVGGI